MSKHKHKQHRQHQAAPRIQVTAPINKPKSTELPAFHITRLAVEQCLMLSTQIFDNINNVDNDSSIKGLQAVQFLMEAGALREKLQELDLQLLVQTSKLNQAYLTAKG
jgi:hypothetical protein